MSETTVRGSRMIKQGRRPKVIEGTRVCAESDCETVLSRYNQHDRCHLHRPLRYPRVRGAVA